MGKLIGYAVLTLIGVVVLVGFANAISNLGVEGVMFVLAILGCIVWVANKMNG